MSNNGQNKIMKQDILNSLKNNLSEKNIYQLIKEFENKSGLFIEISVEMKSYLW
jgi:hypothetical protein